MACSATLDASSDEGAVSFCPPTDSVIILASASPRRRDLLAKAGLRFVVKTPQRAVDETLAQDELSRPQQACLMLAARKAYAVACELLDQASDGCDFVPTEGLRTLYVLGADTMVVKDGAVFGKPISRADAERMLHLLSGATHQVITAVAIYTLSFPLVGRAYEKTLSDPRTFIDISHVTFKELDGKTIDGYLRSGESFDKAGAYAIQGKGAGLVDHYEGALDTVIGLPVKGLAGAFPDIFSF